MEFFRKLYFRIGVRLGYVPEVPPPEQYKVIDWIDSLSDEKVTDLLNKTIAYKCKIESLEEWKDYYTVPVEVEENDIVVSFKT